MPMTPGLHILTHGTLARLAMVDVRSILFVCAASICRSPTAEGVLRRVLAKEGFATMVEIESAGMHEYHAEKPLFPFAVETATCVGFDFIGHIARRVIPGDSTTST